MASHRVEHVIWRQGMLVTPQHLQQESRFHESMLSSRLAALCPLNWGTVELSIDSGALKSGQLRVAKFGGILPGGLPLAFAGNDLNAPTPRAIEAHFPATATVLEVFLGVPNLRPETPDYAEENDDSHRRYKVSTRTVRDAVNPDTEVSLSLAHPNASILFGDEAKGFDAIKIAEVRRDQSGSYALSENYIPPCLQLGGSEYLKKQVQELLSVLIVKARTLSDGLRQRSDSSVEFSNRDVTRFLMLNLFNQNIPLLRHVSETLDASPLALYLQLVEFGGQLATFNAEIDPSEFPQFNHLDLRSSFGELLSTIHSMMGTMVKDVCIPLALEARADGMWIGQLKDERLFDCKAFVLAVESDATEQEVANQLPRLSKMASWKQISQIVRSAVPGVPIKPTHRPPPEVPVRPRRVYFLLELSDSHWKDILEEKTVALYLPPPYDPSRASVSLVGIPSQA